ncbi:helix-turn-helix transcriptional regulator [Sphaerisporangium sp. NPDC051017]|uniref:helix-turn-helix domain-containing protein n=1 Tax=Sphaerisporangium sp. NPDC051017 TaxID=3154636 RepID=UPI00342CB136
MEQVTPIEVVGKRVRELRQRRGMSAQNLADRCAEAGFPELKRQVITNLENGRRESISLTELLGLAYALDAPPALLFIPLDGRTLLRISPEIEMGDLQALMWVSGEREPEDRERRQRWREVAAPVNLHRDLWRLFEVIVQSEWLEDQSTVNGYLRSMAKVLDAMIETGITPPAVPADWVEKMRANGWLEHPGEVRTNGQG